VTEFYVKNTLLFKRYLEEREHILQNKWFMSEKAGYDVGMERALLDWVIHHKKDYLKTKE
jgi:hypothetical protein